MTKLSPVSFKWVNCPLADAPRAEVPMSTADAARFFTKEASVFGSFPARTSQQMWLHGVQVPYYKTSPVDGEGQKTFPRHSRIRLCVAVFN